MIGVKQKELEGTVPQTVDIPHPKTFSIPVRNLRNGQNTGCFISICHFRTTYISITVEDMKTKLFFKTYDLKFTQQKFELKSQRNKRFIKLFTNVSYTSPWLHGTHGNIPPP